MDKDLKEFFEENEVRIGVDYKTSVPEYYSSLNDGFNHYFKTFRDNMDSYHFIIDLPQWKREDIAFSFNTSENVIISILSFHRFIELLLKDILRRINPFLAVKFLEKEDEIFKYLDGNINADEIVTVEFSESFKRFKHAFNHYKENTEIFKNHLEPYQFIKETKHSESIIILSNWRNRIMHNGSKLPNILAFEYLISQRIIPLIDLIIKAEGKFLQRVYKPFYFETPTGISVIDKILKAKFNYKDLKNLKKRNEVARTLILLGHLKEVGRSSYNQNVFFRNNKFHFESSYPNPIERSEKFAISEKSNEHFHKIKKCICCGINSLVVYKREFKTKIFGDGIRWFKCYHCDYSMKDTMLEPKLFGLTDVSIFE